MRAYCLYWLRAATLGAGLNFLIVSNVMANTGWKFHQAAPIGALFSVNCSFMADRLIFRKKKEECVCPKCDQVVQIGCPINYSYENLRPKINRSKTGCIEYGYQSKQAEYNHFTD